MFCFIRLKIAQRFLSSALWVKRKFATPCERVRPTRARKSYEGIKKDRLFYSHGTSGKRSLHIPVSKRVNLKTSGLRKLRFNLRENILKIIYVLGEFILF